MLGNRESASDVTDVPEVEVAERRGLSIVWLIPLVAGAIALWLGYSTLRDQGPSVTISFENAEGLEADKTKVKYKDVEVGVVEDVAISEDLSQIIVTARMHKEAEPYMNDGTRFWIVRPRVGAGGVSGLGTLLSGAFIEVDPGSGAATTAFEGLEEPPPIRSDEAGRRYELHAEKLGSVARGSPVYYRSVEVGQVLGYELADDKENMVIDIFVAAPHDQLVRDNSRFWNASGIDVSVGAEGVNVAVELLQALLAGGIAFDTPAIGRPGEPAAADTVFPLFESFRAVTEVALHREGPLRGLLRRLGAWPAPRRAGRVPGHADRFRDRRPPRDRSGAGCGSDPGDTSASSRSGSASSARTPGAPSPT